MKQITLFFIALLWAMSLSAQGLPELKMTPGFFVNQYSLDSKPATSQEISLHLEKANAKAYHHWKNADGQELGSSISMLVGGIGLLTGVLSKKQGGRIAGYGLAAVGFSVSLGLDIGETSNRKKAINTYNKAAGH